MKSKWIGLALIGVIALIIGIEGVLSVMRQRTLTVTLVLANSEGKTLNQATAAPSSDAPTAKQGTPLATATPILIVAKLPPSGKVSIKIAWNYQIGPRFPEPTLRAEVFNEAGILVAVGQYQIKCKDSSLECKGTQDIPLTFGVTDKANDPQAWQSGAYTVLVTSTIGDLQRRTELNAPLTVE